MNGIDITFNAANFWNIYKPTIFTNDFANIMKPKGYTVQSDHTQAKDQRDTYKINNLFYQTSSGQADASLIFLQTKWSPLKQSFKPFLLSFHDPRFITNFEETGLEIEPGFTTKLKLIRKLKKMPVNGKVLIPLCYKIKF